MKDSEVQFEQRPETSSVVCPHLCEAQFDASLLESAGELFQLLQVAGLLGVGGHRGRHGHTSTGTHICRLISLQHQTHESEKATEVLGFLLFH